MATGKVIQITGPVLDVEFPPGELPDLWSSLTEQELRVASVRKLLERVEPEAAAPSPRARLFLGDVGSYAFGAAMAAGIPSEPPSPTPPVAPIGLVTSTR